MRITHINLDLGDRIVEVSSEENRVNLKMFGEKETLLNISKEKAKLIAESILRHCSEEEIPANQLPLPLGNDRLFPEMKIAVDREEEENGRD